MKLVFLIKSTIYFTPVIVHEVILYGSKGEFTKGVSTSQSQVRSKIYRVDQRDDV